MRFVIYVQLLIFGWISQEICGKAVKVYQAKWKILSVGKPVQSSSMYHGNINPERANDGSPSRYWADGTCFDSRRNDMNPWWIVTFGEDAMVRRVTLLNRNGPDVRLVGIQVATTDNIPEGASWFDIHQHYLCGYVEHIPISGIYSVDCGQKASMVMVYKINAIHLQVCEVTVFGNFVSTGLYYEEICLPTADNLLRDPVINVTTDGVVPASGIMVPYYCASQCYDAICDEFTVWSNDNIICSLKYRL